MYILHQSQNIGRGPILAQETIGQPMSGKQAGKLLETLSDVLKNLYLFFVVVHVNKMIGKPVYIYILQLLLFMPT